MLAKSFFVSRKSRRLLSAAVYVDSAGAALMEGMVDLRKLITASRNGDIEDLKALLAGDRRKSKLLWSDPTARSSGA